MGLRYLLDTHILSDLVRHPRRAVAKRIAREGKDSLCTSIIVAGELRFGAAKRASVCLFSLLNDQSFELSGGIVMNMHFNFPRLIIGLFAFLFLTPTIVLADLFSRNPQCDIPKDGTLNILSINLLFSELATRDTRLQQIAEFADDNDVHVIMLQEVVGGVLAGTDNSAQDLQRFLAALHGLDFELRTAFEAGIPGILSTANAVLSRCEITFWLFTFLPLVATVEFRGQMIPVTQNVMMVRLKIPGHGRLNVYNTHLCANCPVDGRDEQLEVALRFLKALERFFPKNRVVFGGDLNIDNFRDGAVERPLYDKILAKGFIDTYAVAVDDGLENLCETPTSPDKHCTVGVSLLDGSNARRIDYIFARGFQTDDVESSTVVFNTVIDASEPTVSDHAAVFTKLRP